MKKYILLVLFSTIAIGINAQSLVLSNYTTLHNGTVNEGSIDAYVTIENHASNTQLVMAQRTENNLAPNHINLFCFGVSCYTPTTSISPVPDTILAGGSSNTFKSQLLPNYALGISDVKYCFYDQNNISDSVCVRFIYDKHQWVLKMLLKTLRLVNPVLILQSPSRHLLMTYKETRRRLL